MEKPFVIQPPTEDDSWLEFAREIRQVQDLLMHETALSKDPVLRTLRSELYELIYPNNNNREYDYFRLYECDPRFARCHDRVNKFWNYRVAIWKSLPTTELDPKTIDDESWVGTHLREWIIGRARALGWNPLNLWIPKTMGYCPELQYLSLRSFYSQIVQMAEETRELPRSWEPHLDGRLPLPVRNPSDLVIYLVPFNMTLDSYRSLGRVVPEWLFQEFQRGLRNVRRAFNSFGLADTPTLNDDPANINQAEKQLELLDKWFTATTGQSTSSWTSPVAIMSVGEVADPKRLPTAQGSGATTTVEPKSGQVKETLEPPMGKAADESPAAETATKAKHPNEVKPPDAVAGWPTLSPDDLRKLFYIKQDALLRRLKSQTIPNLCITTKAYRVDPTSLPDDWKRTLRRN